MHSIPRRNEDWFLFWEQRVGASARESGSRFDDTVGRKRECVQLEVE